MTLSFLNSLKTAVLSFVLYGSSIYWQNQKYIVNKGQKLLYKSLPTVFQLPMSTPILTLLMIGNKDSMEALLNNSMRKRAYRFLATPKPHALLDLITYRDPTPTNCDNNSEHYKANRCYKKTNLLDRFFMIYTNNYSSRSLAVETQKHPRTLKQWKANSEPTVNSNLCEVYSHFIKKYRENRTTAAFVYTDGSYINQAGSGIIVNFLDLEKSSSST